MSKIINANRPSHRLYQVVEEGKSVIWTPVASAWVHKDGKGYNILVPFIGKIVMREVDARSDDQGRLI
jgi:hypothetical protein